jgi:predicted DNA-binding transcriptional regulator AlpA
MARSTIYRDMAANPPTFPRPIAIGPGSRAWVEAEVQTWIETKIAASRAGAGTAA